MLWRITRSRVQWLEPLPEWPRFAWSLGECIFICILCCADTERWVFHIRAALPSTSCPLICTPYASFLKLLCCFQTPIITIPAPDVGAFEYSDTTRRIKVSTKRDVKGTFEFLIKVILSLPSLIQAVPRMDLPRLDWTFTFSRTWRRSWLTALQRISSHRLICQSLRKNRLVCTRRGFWAL